MRGLENSCQYVSATKFDIQSLLYSIYCLHNEDEVEQVCFLLTTVA